MAVAHLDVTVDHHRRTDKTHRTHADRVAKPRELLLQRRDLRVGMARPDDAQAAGLLAEYHARVLRSAKTDPDDGRLTGKAALAEPHEGVEIEALDALDSVAGKQHTIIRAEQPSLVHGCQIYPSRVGMERVFDLRRVDADIIVVIRAPQRVNPV